MFVFQRAIVFSFFSFCENRFLIILTCYRQCVMHVNDEDILLVKAVSQSYCVLYHSLGEYRLCTDVSIHFFIHSHYHGCLPVSAERPALSHRKHGCLTAVFMSLCVSLLCPCLTRATTGPFLSDVMAYY